MDKREIKFRAWDNKDKKWLLGYEYPNLGGFSMFGEVMIFGEWGEIVNRFFLQQNDRNPRDLILMQYIGLKDKNGKEIYEGDLIDCGADWINIVKWHDGYGGFGLWNESRQMWDSAHLTGMKHVQLIGNIYENSELLK